VKKGERGDYEKDDKGREEGWIEKDLVKEEDKRRRVKRREGWG
jgi:hypothetical protein